MKNARAAYLGQFAKKLQQISAATIDRLLRPVELPSVAAVAVEHGRALFCAVRSRSELNIGT